MYRGFHADVNMLVTLPAICILFVITANGLRFRYTQMSSSSSGGEKRSYDGGQYRGQYGGCDVHVVCQVGSFAWGVLPRVSGGLGLQSFS
jgi:hypothetical protein